MVEERRWIAFSAGAGLVLAVLGVVWGLVARSQVILFDGVFAFVGVAMSGLAISAAAVSRQQPSEKYPFGRDSLVPLVVAAQGAVLLGSCGYAVLESVLTILHGGSIPDARSGLAYAVVGSVAVLLTTWRLRRIRTTSDLVRAEAAGWAAAVPRSLGILVGFVVILLSQGSSWQAVAPYVDPVMVILAASLAVPTAIGMLRSSTGELLERAPDEPTRSQVQEAVDEVAAHYGLHSVTVRMSKLGRKLYVEVDAMADPRRISLGDADVARARLRESLQALGFLVWLTFELHTDPAWDG